LQASLCSAESFFVNQRHPNPTMKNRLLIALTALALSASSAFCADEPKTELGEKMTAISTAFRAIGRQAADATKNADTLTKIASMKTALEASSHLKPATTADKPAAEQAAYVAKFQSEIKDMIALVGKLEEAIKGGHNDAAAKIIDEVKAEQSKDHKEFRKQAAK